MNIKKYIEIYGLFVTLSSIVGSALPPYERFADFPRFQKVYKVIDLTILQWSSLNIKHVLYPEIKSISNAGGTGPADPNPGGKRTENNEA